MEQYILNIGGITIFSEYSLYKEELDLIMRQNPIECELYSVIATLLRGRAKFRSLSIRDVSSRRLSKFTNSFIYSSASGFPDFIFLSKDFSLMNQVEYEKDIFGAVEVKRISLGLDYRGDLPKQIQDHITKFHNVIYTNGLEWRFYTLEYKFEAVWSFTLGKIENGMIYWESEDVWNSLISSLDGIDWSK